MPFNRFADYRKTIKKYRLQPEIGLEGDLLYTTPTRTYADAAAFLRDEGLACTLHAPFADLSPGAQDQYIRTVSRDKLHMAFDLLEIFKPRAIVCHLGYEENKHGYAADTWFEHTLATWRSLLPAVEEGRTRLMFENTYETGPTIHRRLLEALDTPKAGFCLDVGHLLAFAHTGWRDWLPEMNPWLGQLHLHDNHGNRDEHLPIGAGSFDFQDLFTYLQGQKITPIITLEPHQETHLWQSLNSLEALLPPS